jgi:hypothetical protein
MNSDFFSFVVVAEMMQSDVEMLGSRSVLVNPSHLQSAAIVFKDMTVHLRLWRLKIETFPFVAFNNSIKGIASLNA